MGSSGSPEPARSRPGAESPAGAAPAFRGGEGQVPSTPYPPGGIPAADGPAAPPPSLRAAVTARPPAKRSGLPVGSGPPLEAVPGEAADSPGRVREIIASLHIRTPAQPRKEAPSAASPASAEGLVSLPSSEGTGG